MNIKEIVAETSLPKLKLAYLNMWCYLLKKKLMQKELMLSVAGNSFKNIKKIHDIETSLAEIEGYKRALELGSTHKDKI